MLAGDTAEDERMGGGSHNSKVTQNGLLDMTELKDFIGKEIRDGLSTMERNLVHRSEKRFAELNEQLVVLQSNFEDQLQKQLRNSLLNFEKRFADLTEQQAELQYSMEEIAKKQYRMEKKLDTVLNNLDPQATWADSSPSSDCIVPRQQYHQGLSPGVESSTATGWHHWAKPIWSLMCSMGVMPSQGGSSENLTMFTQPPPSMTLTRSTCVVSTIANNIQMVLNQQNRPSTQMPNDNTMPTFMCQQPRSHAQSALVMPSAPQRRQLCQNISSCSQNVPQTISSEDFLQLARQFQNKYSPSGICELSLVLQHANSNTTSLVVAQVSKQGHNVANWIQSFNDQATPPIQFDQTPIIPRRPLQVQARRMSSSGDQHPKQLITRDNRGDLLVTEMEIQWLAAIVSKRYSHRCGNLYRRLSIETNAVDKIKQEKLPQNSQRDIETEVFLVVNYGWRERENPIGGGTRGHLIQQLHTFEERLAVQYADYINNCDDFSIMGPVDPD